MEKSLSQQVDRVEVRLRACTRHRTRQLLIECFISFPLLIGPECKECRDEMFVDWEWEVCYFCRLWHAKAGTSMRAGMSLALFS